MLVRGSCGGAKRRVPTETGKREKEREVEEGDMVAARAGKKKTTAELSHDVFLFFILDDVESRATSQPNVARFLATTISDFLIRFDSFLFPESFYFFSRIFFSVNGRRLLKLFGWILKLLLVCPSHARSRT